MFKPFILAVIYLVRLRKKILTDEEALKCFEVHSNRYETFDVQRVEAWAEDDRLAFRKIHELNENNNSFLYQLIDFHNGVSITGHFCGGALSYYHCLHDDEISCGVNIDDGLFGSYGEMLCHKPFMQILNKGNENVFSRSRIFHDRSIHYMVFKDVEHNGFTDKNSFPEKHQ